MYNDFKLYVCYILMFIDILFLNMFWLPEFYIWYIFC